MTITVNGTPIKSFNFPGGECSVTVSQDIIDYDDDVKIVAELNGSDDIMCLLLTVDALRRIIPDIDICLYLPYFPYARQDRVCNAGEALSAKVMADLINSLNCTTVMIFDPHSDVVGALLNNCHIATLDVMIKVPHFKAFRKKIISCNLLMVSPDAGAEKKVRSLAKTLSTLAKGGRDYICASKIRDTSTGEITSTKIYDDVKGRDVIIIDDLCDGGRTFIELSKVLKDAGANDIYLYVTYGIFSKGLDVLKPHFKHVYCYHARLEYGTNFLTILY